MKNTTPVYTKWITASPMRAVAPFARTSSDPDPVPFEEVHEEENHTVGPPSTSSDGYSNYGSFTIPEGENGETLYGTCSLFLGVDDWGSLEVRNSSGQVVAKVDLKEDSQDAGDQGGHKYHTSTGGAQLPSGSYSWEVNQTNIDYQPPSGNVSICNYKIDIVPTEPGGKTNPEPCPCEGDTCNNDGGSPSGPYARFARNGGAGESSSAGCSVSAESTATLMYWSCNFGAFRGLGSIPAGRVELRAEDGVSGLQNPVSLAFNHPLDSRLDVPEGGIIAGSRFDLVQGERVIAMRCDTNGVDIRPVGVDTQGGGIASLVTVNEQRCMQWIVMDGSVYLYSAETGKLLSYTTPDKQTITNASSYLDVKRDEGGALRQIWNLWDGLLNVENVTVAGYTIALYTPGQITGTDEDGRYTVTGAPFKTFILSLSEGETCFTIMEQTPGRQDYAVAWWKNGQAWSMRKGTGEDALLTTRVRTELEPSVWQLVTEQSRNATVASRVCEIYQTTDVGDLLLTRVNGYGSAGAQTTQYAYDQCGRLKTQTAPDGSLRHWTYDDYGRTLSYDEPWVQSGRRITRYAYAHSAAGNFNDEISVETVELRPTEGHVKTLTTTAYAYTISNHVKRTEKRITGLGVAGTRLTVTEQWQSTAPNQYARGRTRMIQAVDGVQTWYDYAAATDHSALYTETQETRINGNTVAGQSTRNVTYITAEGQRVREESFVLLSNGEWALTDSADYEFDTQNRWVKRIRGNGRITERELMCDGRTLWEKDEDGIITANAYDTARQLIETTRSAVMDGDTVITPEMIVSYSRDAAGHALQTRRDTGAMTTVESSQYDLLGRTVSSTDILGRVTTSIYSEDGLTATQTLPSGATFTTRSAPDGTVMEQSGTGQRHIHVFIDLANDGIRTYTRAVTGETETELQRAIVNGIGETLRTGIPNTIGGTIFTRHTYNAKGQLTQTQTDAESSATTMAPTLWEYDGFGNRTKETWKLENNPTLANSRITTWAYGMEQSEDGGVYRVVSATKNNGQGTTYTETQKELVSSLNPSLERKTLSIDPRGNVTTQWTEYGAGPGRVQKNTVPSSNITATVTVIDGFTTVQTDHAGVTTAASRVWTATGIIYTSTDARNNHTITQTDIAGRIISVTDAAGSITTTEYDDRFDLPSVVTNALGKTTCCGYDLRGRKTAEYGMVIQPACFGYDEADRMVSLTTYRADAGDITTDPSERTDGDTTTWTYHEGSGLMTRKTYADGTHEDTTYNALNMKAAFTDARGIITTYGYNLKKGVNTSIAYSDGTPGLQFVWNPLNQLFRVTDGSGTRNIGYNQYAEPETDSIVISGTTYLLTETRDTLGRSVGYLLDKGTTVVQDVTQSYATDGRIAHAGIMHNGIEQNFTYGYLQGTNLLADLSMPNGIVKELAYEQNRDLVTGIAYRRGEAVLSARTQNYDVLGRPTSRTQQRGAEAARTDSFTYNDRSELAAATLGTDLFGYGYDNIGNRKTAQERAKELVYTANELNQYTSIAENEETPFVPQFDAAGNQTLLKTATGIWTVAYNAASRPVSFTSQDGNTVVECGYDYMGRRHMKKVTVNGTVTKHERYLYRGYLQIAALDLLDNQNVLRTILWDPMEPVATRPLALVQDNAVYCYGHDFIKNVTEVFDEHGTVTVTYDYTPYGVVTAIGNVVQPVQWSSEVNDDELVLVYYNFRHYNPSDGRWINRDPIAEEDCWNLYLLLFNNSMNAFDLYGLEWKATDESAGQRYRIYVSEKGDSIKNLAKIVNLKESESKKWILSKHKSKNDPTKYCYAKVPNTVIAYWAGDMGALGRWWVDWNDNIRALQKDGYYVENVMSTPSTHYATKLNLASINKSLRGTYFWGHGVYIEDDPSKRAKGLNERNDGVSWFYEFNLKYTLSFAYLYACDSNEARNAIKAIIWLGFTGTLVPWNPWRPIYTKPKDDLKK